MDNQVAIIRARVATWEQTKATLVLAQAEFDRAQHLLATKVVSAEEYDQKRETLDVAKAQVQQALESIYQARVASGCPPNRPQGQASPTSRPISTRTFPPSARLLPICSRMPPSSA